MPGTDRGTWQPGVARGAIHSGGEVEKVQGLAGEGVADVGRGSAHACCVTPATHESTGEVQGIKRTNTGREMERTSKGKGPEHVKVAAFESASW
jgi:hypothetical protein